MICLTPKFLRGTRWKCLWRLALTFVGLLFLGSCLIAWAGWKDDLQHCDVALVLGTKVNLDGTPGTAMRVRCQAAIRAYKSGLVKHVVVSGATGVEGHDESLVMRNYCIENGVRPEDITADSEGWNTFLSARNTRDIAREKGFTSVVAVSQYYHLPRAKLALRRFGFTQVHATFTRYWSWKDIYAIPREAIGYVNYWIRSYE